MLKHNKFVTAILLTLCAASASYADSTLVYQLTIRPGIRLSTPSRLVDAGCDWSLSPKEKQITP